MAKLNKKKLYQIAAASGIVAIPTATTLGVVYGTQEDKVRMYAKTAETYGEKFFDKFVADSSSSFVAQKLITPFRPYAQGGTLTELTRLDRDFDTDAAHKIIKRNKNGTESFALKRVKIRTQDILREEQLESAFNDANKELYQFVHSPLMQGRNLAIHIGQDMRNREIVASIYEVRGLEAEDQAIADQIFAKLGSDPVGPFKNDANGAFSTTGKINQNGFMQILSSQGMIYGKLKYYLNLKDTAGSNDPSVWSDPVYQNSIKKGAGLPYGGGHVLGDDSVSLTKEKEFDDFYGYASKTVDQWNENRGDLYKVSSLTSDDTGSHGLHAKLRQNNIVAFYEPSIDWIRKELVITYNIYKMDKNSTFYFGQADSIKNPVAVYKKVIRKSLSMFGNTKTLSTTNTSAGAVPGSGQKTEHNEFRDILKDFFTRQIVRYLANPIVKPGLGLLGKIIPSAAAAFGDLMSLGEILSFDNGKPNVPVTDLGHPMNPNYVPMNGKGNQAWHDYVYQGIFNDENGKTDGTKLLDSIIDKLEKDPAVDVKGVMKTMKEFQHHAFGDGNADSSDYPLDYWTNQEHLAQTYTYNGGQYHLYQMASAFNSISALLYKAIDDKFPVREVIKNEDLVGDLMRLLKTRGVVPHDYSITNLLSDPIGELFHILVEMGKKGVVLPVDMAKKILPLVPFAGISNNIDGWANALSYLTQPGNINAVLKLLGNNETDQLKNFKDLLSADTRWEALDRIFAPKAVSQQSIMILMKTIKLTGILPSALNVVLGDTPTKADIYVKLFANGGAQSLFHMIRDIFSKGLLEMGTSPEITGINLAVGSETVMSTADLSTTKTWMHSLPEFVKRYLLMEIKPSIGETAITSATLDNSLDAALDNPTGATTPAAITYAKLKEAFDKTEILIKNKFVKDLFTVQEDLDDKIHNFTLNTDEKIEAFYDKDDSETKTLRNFENWLMKLHTDVSEYYHLSELGSTAEQIASGVEVSRRRLVLQTRYAEYYKVETDAKRTPVEYNNWRRNLYAPKGESFYAHTVKDDYFKLSEKDLVAKHTAIYIEGYLKTKDNAEYTKFIKAREAAIKLTCAVAESFGIALPTVTSSTPMTADVLWDLARKIYAAFETIRKQTTNRGQETLAQIRKIELYLQNKGSAMHTHLANTEWDVMPAFEDEAQGVGNIFLTTKNRNAIAKWIFEQKDSIKTYIASKNLISGFQVNWTEAQIRAKLTFEEFGYTELQNIYKAFSVEEETKTHSFIDLLLTDGTKANSVFAFGTQKADAVPATGGTNSKTAVLDWIKAKDNLRYIDNFATYISKSMWNFNHLAPLYGSSEVPTDASSSQAEKDAFKAKAISSIKAILDMPDFNIGILELTFRQLMPVDAFTAYAHELGPKLIDAALTGDLAAYAPTAGVVFDILFGVIDNLLRKPITYHSQYSIFGQIKPELGSADFTANALLFPVLGILGEKIPALQKYVPDADTLKKALSNIFDIFRSGMQPFFQNTADSLKDQGYTFNQTVDAILSMNILKSFFPSGFVKGKAGEPDALSVPAVSTVVGGLLHGFNNKNDMINAIKGIMPSVEESIPVLGSVANILKNVYDNGKLSLGGATGFVHDDELLTSAGSALQILLTKGLLNMSNAQISDVLNTLRNIALKANEIKSNLGIFSSFLSGEKFDSIFKIFENLAKGLTSTTIPSISEALHTIMHEPFNTISSAQINSIIDLINSLGLLKSNIPHLGHLVHALFAPGGLSDPINGINALDIKNLMSVLGMSDSTSEILIKAFFGEDFKADFMKSTNTWIQTIKTNMPVKVVLKAGARAIPNNVQSFENLKSLLDAAITQLETKLDPNNPAPIAEMYKQHDIVEQARDKLLEYNALVRARNDEADALVAKINLIAGQTLPKEVVQTGLTADQVALLEGRTYTALEAVFNGIKTANSNLAAKTYDQLIDVQNQYIRALKAINDYNSDVTRLKKGQPIETSVQKLAKLIREITETDSASTTAIINVEQMKALVNTYGVRVFQDLGLATWSSLSRNHAFLTTSDLTSDSTKKEVTSNMFSSFWMKDDRKIKVDLSTLKILATGVTLS